MGASPNTRSDTGTPWGVSGFGVAPSQGRHRIDLSAAGFRDTLF
jgi:hypothetical protein